jgi:outer membrane protein with beta-barrel domain
MKTATALIFSLILAAPVFAGDAITVFGGGFSRDHVADGPGVVVGNTFYPPGPKAEWNGEIGIAASHAWNQRWSTEASVAFRQSHQLVSRFVDIPGGPTNVPGGTFAPVTENARTRTYPVDLSMRYHLANGTRWKPYLSAGARYVNGSHVLVNYIQPDQSGFSPVLVKRAADRRSAEVGGGLTMMLTHGFGVRGDYKRLLRSDDSEFDPINRATFGLEWNF